MANALTTKLVIWDDADKSPDLMKVLSMGARISDRRRFSWGEIKLDRTNPEVVGIRRLVVSRPWNAES